MASMNQGPRSPTAKKHTYMYTVVLAQKHCKVMKFQNSVTLAFENDLNTPGALQQ